MTLAAPTLTVGLARGAEDTAIALTISADITGASAATLFSVEVGGVPAGARLSAGVDNGDGTWTLTRDQLAGLTLTPPANADAGITLTVTATAYEPAEDIATMATATATLSGNGSRNKLTGGTGSDVIDGKSGADTMAGRGGDDVYFVDNAGDAVVERSGEGTDTVVSRVTHTLTANVENLVLAGNAAINGTGNGLDNMLAGNSGNNVFDGGAGADTAVYGGKFTDYVLTYNVNGSVTVDGGKLGHGIDTLTNIELVQFADSVLDVATRTIGASIGRSAESEEILIVQVDAKADAPILSVAAAKGAAGTAIPLNLAAALVDADGSEALSVKIGGLPAGTSLSAGTKNADGSWSLSAAQLAGLKLVTGATASGSFNLAVTATSTETANGSTAAVSKLLAVTVDPAPTPTPVGLTVTPTASGREDAAIALTIASDKMVTISGVPAGASLSAGTKNADGTWTVTTDKLAGLTFKGAPNASGEVRLTVSTGATAVAGPSATLPTATKVGTSANDTLQGTDGNDVIDGKAGSDTMAGGKGDDIYAVDLYGEKIVENAGEGTDTAYYVNSVGSYVLPANVENLVLSGAGATSGYGNAGNNVLMGNAYANTLYGNGGVDTIVYAKASTAYTIANAGSGWWTVTDKATGVADRVADIDFIRFSDGTYDFATGTMKPSGQSATIQVSVTAVADAPTLGVTAATGTAGSAIPLAIAAALVDKDGSETLALTITGVPAGASLSAGTKNADGSWSLTAAQANGLTLNGAAAGDFSLNVTAISREASNGATASKSAILAVHVDAASTPTPTPTPTNYLVVGAGEKYTTVASAIAAAKDGDTIYVKAGTYTNDFATITKKVSLVGVGGMVKMVATTTPTSDKGIFVVQNDVSFDHFEFSGAKSSGKNGAGIRYESGNLVVRNSYFHDNEDGILANPNATGTITIANSEFARNGYGDGQSHGIYVNAVKQLTITDSYFHDQKVGHHIKSRALNSTITGNVLDDGAGNSSYAIDLPNGGNAVVKDNTMVQSATGTNPIILAYGAEGNLHASSSALIEANVFANYKSSSTGIQNFASTVTAKVVDNQFYNVATLVNGPATQTGSVKVATAPSYSKDAPWDEGYATLPGSEPTPTPEPTPEPIPSGDSSLGIVVLQVSGSVSKAMDAPAASTTGDIVGVVLENQTGSAEAGSMLSLGQVFVKGDVRPGDTLVLKTGSGAIPVQMDVKATNDDGSVRHAILTFKAPDMAAGTALKAMIAKGGTADTAPTLTAQDIIAKGYDFKVDFKLHNADGSISTKTVDAAQVLQQAIAAGTADTWMKGGQATEVRVHTSVNGQLEAYFDIRVHKDGSIKTDFSVENAWTYKAGIKTNTYDVAVRQSGQVAYQESGIDHYRNTTWHKEFWKGDHSDLHVVRDMDYFVQTGAVPTYDTTLGMNSAKLSGYVSTLNASNTDPMGAAMVQKDMWGTGGRDDIGPTTAWSAAYVASQDARAEKVMLANADAAGSIPWHFRDEATGDMVRIDQHPNLWIDERGTGSRFGKDALPEAYTEPNGWNLDTSHQPDLTYIPYLVTGSHYYLDQMMAQATYSLASIDPTYRNYGEGSTDSGQLRARAWEMRAIGNAAYATPDNDTMKGFFTKVVGDNLTDYYNNYAVGTKNDSGAIEGWIKADAPSGQTAPWQNDFFAVVMSYLDQRDFNYASEIADWQSNFVAGRFLAGDEGYNPYNGTAYYINTYNASTGVNNTSWSQVWSQTFGTSSGLTTLDGYPDWAGGYAANAKASMASLISATGNPEAVEAYGFLTYNTTKMVASYRNDFQWAIQPKLADGTVLNHDHITVQAGTTAATMTGGEQADLLHGNVGADVINGNGGIDLLFGGGGNDSVNGGAGNDYVFGNDGNDRLAGGTGADYLKGGHGSDVFVFTTANGGHDMVLDFVPGADRLEIKAGLNGGPATAAQLIATATLDANGNMVLHLGGDDIVLLGVHNGQLTTASIAMV